MGLQQGGERWKGRLGLGQYWCCNLSGKPQVHVHFYPDFFGICTKIVQGLYEFRTEMLLCFATSDMPRSGLRPRLMMSPFMNTWRSSASGKQFQRDFIVQLRYKIPASGLLLVYRQHRSENPPDRDCIMDEGVYA